MGLIQDAVLVTLVFMFVGAMFIFVITPITTSTGEELNLGTYFIQGISELAVNFGQWITCGLLGIGCP